MAITLKINELIVDDKDNASEKEMQITSFSFRIKYVVKMTISANKHPIIHLYVLFFKIYSFF